MSRFIPTLLIGAAMVSLGCHSHVTPQQMAQREEMQFLLRDQKADAARLQGEGYHPREGAVAQTTGQAVGGLHFLFVEFPHRVYDHWHGNTPAKYARDMEDNSPDLRRLGILELSGYPFARDPRGPEVVRYRQIAITDSNPLVRAAAIRALNRARYQKATPLFIKYLGDSDMLVRLESAKALANIPEPLAVPVLQEHLARDENKDVRIACADALRLYKTLESARSLIAVLSDSDFGVAWQAHHSLRLMTDKDFGYDEGAWLGYVSQSQNPFR